MEEGASGGNPEKPAAADGGSGSGGAGAAAAAAAAEPKAALTEDVNGSGAELWKEDSSRMDKKQLWIGCCQVHQCRVLEVSLFLMYIRGLKF